MTLVSITFSGYIVGDVVFIVGSVTGKLGGSALIAERLIFFVSFCLFFSFFFLMMTWAGGVMMSLL